MELNNSQLITIYGGSVGVSASMLNAIARGIAVVYSLGRAFGSGIRYVFGKSYCKGSIASRCVAMKKQLKLLLFD